MARILAAATELVRTRGVTGFTMSAVAQQARIPIGSLYQYFPTKTELIHRMFLDRLRSYHQLMIDAVQGSEAPEQCARALHNAVLAIYEANRHDPLMQDIWAGAQADRQIRGLHVKDNEFYYELLMELSRRARTPLSGDALQRRVIVVNELLDSSIRHAIEIAPGRARALLEDAVAVAVQALGFAIGSA